jgi:hypothetical protein
VTALDSRFLVHVDDAEAAARLEHLWRAAGSGDPAPTPPVTVVVDQNGQTRATSGTDSATGPAGSAVETAGMVMNRLALGRFAGVALHAGVVGTATGVIVLPGQSGQGKSTLTAACVQAGFDYVSDEALCLRWDADVVPYRKPFGLSADSRRLLELPDVGEGSDADVLDFGLLGAGRRTPGRVAHVVELQRAAGRARLEPRHRADTLAVLLPRCFHHYRDPVRTLEVLAAVSRGSQAWTLRYDDPRAAADLLLARWGG